jgi:photosystem II stability/assembly factor-like uncharacterized protein
MTSIAVDPANADVAYVTVSGYRSGDNGAHVWRTANGGTTWRDISGNLPNAPVNRLVLDPRTPAVLYVASDVGIFSSPNGGTSWQALGSGLPAVPVADLDVLASGSSTVLTAATFGLGMYRLTTP